MSSRQNRKTRPPRISKKIDCFIVEGYTEKNYIKLLKTIYRKDAKIVNSEGGSAKKVLEEAKKIINKNSDDYKSYIVWFDNDRFDSVSDRNLKDSLSSKEYVEIYISRPCVENWILAHFEPIQENEVKCEICEKKLKDKYIPNYEKNDHGMLTRFITKAEIEIAIANYRDVGKMVEKFRK